jgi:hypothetical protein
MPAVTRSKKNEVDQLSGLMSSINITPKSTHRTPRVKKEKDISDLLSGLALSSKSRRRRKGLLRFTHKKSHKTSEPANDFIDMSEMMLGGKRRSRRRHRRKSRRN